jgi:hypothetical protein
MYRVDNLERLAAIKKQWDPDKVFGFSNGIPPNYTMQESGHFLIYLSV